MITPLEREIIASAENALFGGSRIAGRNQGKQNFGSGDEIKVFQESNKPQIPKGSCTSVGSLRDMERKSIMMFGDSNAH